MFSLEHLLTRTGARLWLPLIFLSGGLWLVGSAWTQHYLGVASREIAPLVLVPNIAAQTDGLLSIRATLNRDRPFTRVEVIVVKPVPRTLDFYLPVQSPDAIEAEMAKRLNVSSDTIRRLIRYENVVPQG